MKIGIASHRVNGEEANGYLWLALDQSLLATPINPASGHDSVRLGADGNDYNLDCLSYEGRELFENAKAKGFFEIWTHDGVAIRFQLKKAWHTTTDYEDFMFVTELTLLAAEIFPGANVRATSPLS
jgi:hypothetical protein